MAVAVASMVVAGLGVAAGLARPDDNYGSGSSVGALFAWALECSAFSGVGALIALRHPGHRVGWLLLLIGGLQAVGFSASTVMTWGIQTGSLSPQVASWVGTGTTAGVVGLALVGTQLPLRLPDGRCLSARWRRFSWFALAAVAAGSTASAVQPGRIDQVPGTSNPLGISGAGPFASLFFLVIVAFVASVVSVARRYRRVGTHDRAQLRWIGLGAGVFLSCYLVALSLLVFEPSKQSSLNVLIEPLFVLALTALPVTIGAAILRHGLYDIDVVINRALVYGALSVSLAGAYAASVLLLQAALAGVTQDSGLAVAASTLVVAGLFGPVRARIQRAVDMRFFRRRYDAAVTLQAFVARTRDEVDLDALAQELQVVATETMQPAHVSLWLRDVA